MRQVKSRKILSAAFSTGHRNLRNGLLFTGPWIIGFLIFTVWPLLSSLFYSFTEYSVGSNRGAVFTGFKNYLDMFNDEIFWSSLGNTTYILVISIPLGTVVSIAVALLLNTKVKGLAFWRTIFYLPSIVPLVPTLIIWLWILDPMYGILNWFLSFLHIPPVGWLTDPNIAKISLILMGLWGIGNSVVIYLAGLQQIPLELLEAASIDGANAWNRIRHITIPMLSPVIFFNIIMGVIGGFQYFTQPMILFNQNGGPGGAARTLAMYIYMNAFTWWRMGYASALAWVLFLIVIILTALLFRGSRDIVHYGGETH